MQYLAILTGVLGTPGPEIPAANLPQEIPIAV